MKPHDINETLCPTCGSRVGVVGKTTMHYEPVAKAVEARNIDDTIHDLLWVCKRVFDVHDESGLLDKVFLKHARMVLEMPASTGGET